MRLLVSLLLAMMIPSAASALVGGAPAADAVIARHIVLILGSKGTFCTGAAIARDLVLTAAHCALPGADYKIAERGADGRPVMRDVASVARHPQFSVDAFLNARATADVALIKLAQPLPPAYVPAPLANGVRRVAVGEALLVVGYGVSAKGDGKTGGTIRAASLAVSGQPGTLQVRLYDPATRNTRTGLGACTGDSGAPVFEESAAASSAPRASAAGVNGKRAIMGVVSWSTGPGNSDGCGGLTGVTPLARYKDWIVKQARAMGSAL